MDLEGVIKIEADTADANKPIVARISRAHTTRDHIDTTKVARSCQSIRLGARISLRENNRKSYTCYFHPSLAARLAPNIVQPLFLDTSKSRSASKILNIQFVVPQSVPDPPTLPNASTTELHAKKRHKIALILIPVCKCHNSYDFDPHILPRKCHYNHPPATATTDSPTAHVTNAQVYFQIMQVTSIYPNGIVRPRLPIFP